MVSLVVHVLFLVYFVILLLLSIQQLLIQSCAQKDFVLYRALLVISVFNEIVVLVILFDEQTDATAVISRALIWGNLFWGSYILYKLGKMGADGLYNQMTANKEKSPPWFVLFWRLNCASNAVVLLACMIAAFATGRQRAMEFHALYLDFLIVVTSIIFIAILLKVRYRLHMVENKLKHQVSVSLGNKNSNTDITNTKKHKEMQRKLDVEQQNLKKLRLITKTRIRMDFAAFLILLIIPGTLFGTITILNNFEKAGKEPITEPIYTKSSTFLSHFIFSLLYESICFLWLYRNSKFCIHFAIDSCYSIICINKLRFKGFDKFSSLCYLIGGKICPIDLLRTGTHIETQVYIEQDEKQQQQQQQQNGESTEPMPHPAQLKNPHRSDATQNSQINLELAKKELEAMTGLNVTDLEGLLSTANLNHRHPSEAQQNNNNNNNRLDTSENSSINTSSQQNQQLPPNSSLGNAKYSGGQLKTEAETHPKPRSKVPSQTVTSTITVTNSSITNNSDNRNNDISKNINNMSAITESQDATGYSNEDAHLAALTARRETEPDSNKDENGLNVLPLRYNNSDGMAFRGSSGDIPGTDDDNNRVTIDIDDDDLPGTPKNNSSAPGTPTQAQQSQTATTFWDNELSSRKKKLDLNKIDYYGNEKGKRDKKKVKKMRKERRQEIKNNMEKRPIAEESKHQFDTQLMARYKTHDPHNEPTAFSQGDVLDRLEEKRDDDGVDSGNEEKPPVTLVIYEFEHTLSTLPHKIADKTSEDIEDMDLQSIVFLFGGENRLEELHEHLSEVFVRQQASALNGNTNNNNNQNEPAQQPMCFVLTNEYSETVFKVLERVRLVEYFVSVNPNAVQGRKVKKLSHVIGYDHKLMKETSRKKYLIILKLIQFLRRDHDSVLYIGHDKEVIEQLKSISVCRTYYVETKGMTKKDFDQVENKHF